MMLAALRCWRHPRRVAIALSVCLPVCLCNAVAAGVRLGPPAAMTVGRACRRGELPAARLATHVRDRRATVEQR